MRRGDRSRGVPTVQRDPDQVAAPLEATTLLRPQTIGRLAGLLFLLGGGAMVPLVLLSENADERRTSLLVIVGVCAFATIASQLMPWDRWPRWATLAIAPLACGVVAVANTVSPDPGLYSTFLLLVFAWIGVAHPPGTSLRLFFLVVVVFLAPQVAEDRTARDEAIRAIAIVTPVCIVVGEGLSRVLRRLRDAEAMNARRVQDLRLLVDATIRLARANEPRQTANLVAELAVQLLGADSSLVLLAPQAGALQPAGAFKWELGAEAAPELEDGAARALATGELTRKADGSLAFLPLIGSTGPQGLIVVTGAAASLSDSFTSGLARTFTTQATVAFERVRAVQTLVDASFRDPVTGVGNRKRAEAALALLANGDAIAIVDVENFADLVEKAGRPNADALLKRIARHLQDGAHGNDLIARTGDDRFTIILRNSGDKTDEVLRRISAAWDAAGLGISLAVGAAVNRLSEAATATVARAEEALAAARAAGSGRVAVAPDPERAAEPVG